jgi:hypothetical protein
MPRAAPQGLKAAFFFALGGMAKQAAEKRTKLVISAFFGGKMGM